MEIRVTKALLVPVVVRGFERGDPISDSDVVYREIDVTSIRSKALSKEASLEKRTATRRLREGDVLTVGNTEVPPVIRRGEAVVLIVRVGALEVTARGMAKQDGAEGEVITVVNRESNRRVEGRVLGPGRILVNEKRRSK